MVIHRDSDSSTVSDCSVELSDFVIDLSYSCLSTLSCLENAESVVHLILDGNSLNDSIQLPDFPYLTTLSLNKNKLTDLNSLLCQIQSKCPNLNHLSLLGNPLCPHPLTSSAFTEAEYVKYRLTIIRKLAAISFLDSSPVTRSEQRIATNAAAANGNVRSTFPGIAYSAKSSGIYGVPNGATFDSTDCERAHIEDCVYAKVKYEYNGKNSEGNRFIRDRHL